MPQAFEPCGLYDLDPITIGVFDEGDVLHFSLVGTLDKSDLILIEPSDSSVQVGH